MTAALAENKPIADEELLAMIGAEPEPDPVLKVSFPPDAYRKAIAFVAGIAPKKSTLPVLSMLHCQSNGSTSFRSTDLDIFASVEMPEVATVEGECLLPKAALLTALKSGKRVVTIDLQPKLMVDIVADGMKQPVPSLPVCEFVPLPVYKAQGKPIQISAKLFIAALKQVELAMSVDSSRYILNSVLLELREKKLVLIGTDGRRLHKSEIGRMDSQSFPEPVPILLPTPTINHLLKLPLDATHDLLMIEWDKEQSWVRLGHNRISRLTQWSPRSTM